MFTGAIPFSDKPPRAVMLAVVGGERPPRPTHPTFPDGLWVLIQRCWGREARLRPEMAEVLRVLHSLLVTAFSTGYRQPDRVLVCSGPPTWKRLVIRPLVTHKCIPLIAVIFSDKNEIRAVQSLRGDDAQAFIDVIDEVPPTLFHLGRTDKLIRTQTFYSTE